MAIEIPNVVRALLTVADPTVPATVRASGCSFKRNGVGDYLVTIPGLDTLSASPTVAPSFCLAVSLLTGNANGYTWETSPTLVQGELTFKVKHYPAGVLTPGTPGTIDGNTVGPVLNSLTLTGTVAPSIASPVAVPSDAAGICLVVYAFPSEH